MKGLIFFAVVLVCNVVSQLLEKKGMAQVGSIVSLRELWHIKTLLTLATNPYVVGGVILSAIGIIFWLGALSTLNLSYIAPMGAITYILIALISWIVLGESITALHWAGIIVIGIGVWMVQK